MGKTNGYSVGIHHPPVISIFCIGAICLPLSWLADIMSMSQIPCGLMKIEGFETIQKKQQV